MVAFTRPNFQNESIFRIKFCIRRGMARHMNVVILTGVPNLKTTEPQNVIFDDTAQGSLYVVVFGYFSDIDTPTWMILRNQVPYI